MSEHLSPDYVARYLKRSLSRAERTAADAHLEQCATCRQLVSESPDLQDAFVSFRDGLKATAAQGLSHLQYEQLEAYVDSTMSDVDREIVESHVDRCRVCGGELHDLQQFQQADAREMTDVSDDEEPITLMASAEIDEEVTRPVGVSRILATSGAPPAPRSPVPPKVSPFGRFPWYLGGATAVAVIVLTVAMVTMRLHQATPSKSITTIAQSPPQSTPPDNSGNIEHSLTAHQVPHASVAGPERLETPAALAQLIGKKGTLMGAAGEQESFALLRPVGTFVLDSRPEFRWQALAGATEYRVGVFDADLKAIETSPALTSTTWKSSQALRRGKVYVWQVTAAKGSEQVVAPAPPAPEAKFAVVDQNGANDIIALKSASLGEHFELGRAYARAGLLDEAEQEFQLVPVADSNYSQAQRYLSDLKALRHP